MGYSQLYYMVSRTPSVGCMIRSNGYNTMGTYGQTIFKIVRTSMYLSRKKFKSAFRSILTQLVCFFFSCFEERIMLNTSRLYIVCYIQLFVDLHKF